MNKPEFTLDQIRKFVDTGYTSVSARMVKSLLQHYDELLKSPICLHCQKYKKMQGNGIMHQLCECGKSVCYTPIHDNTISDPPDGGSGV